MTLLETWGEPKILAAIGFGVGVIFGLGAQRSAFCMRAAVIEFVALRPGPRLWTWLWAFLVALTGTQALVALALVDLSQARQIAATGSVSGALIGGVMFGIGMILARGCPSRLLILAASGNLRAMITGLVLTLVAQSALSGILAPAREVLSGLWTVPGGPSRSLLGVFGVSRPFLLGAALTGLGALLALGLLQGWLDWAKALGATAVGLAVAAGWGLTAWVAAVSFEIVPVSSITFTGPFSDTLMALVTSRNVALTFAIGLVPGVATGAILSALASGAFKIERFGPETPMERYLLGAALMGFGSMMAGGCAVGAVVSGGAVLSLTALLAGMAMWLGAGLTQLAFRHNGRA